jgi:hypothetical protein
MKLSQIGIFLCLLFVKPVSAGTVSPIKDEPYAVPVSVKYTLSPKWKDVHFKKVVADGDNSILN